MSMENNKLNDLSYFMNESDLFKHDNSNFNSDEKDIDEDIDPELGLTESQKQEVQKIKDMANKIITELKSVDNINCTMFEDFDGHISINIIHFLSDKTFADEDKSYTLMELDLNPEGIEWLAFDSYENQTPEERAMLDIDHNVYRGLPLFDEKYMSELRSVLKIVKKYKVAPGRSEDAITKDKMKNKIEKMNNINLI